MRSIRVGRRAAAAVLTAVLLLTGCGSGGGASAPPTAQTVETLEELVAAAKEEGTLTLYGAPAEPAVKAVAAAFTEKYGVNVNVVRIVSGQIIQRFSNEIGANAPSADVLLMNQTTFLDRAREQGWITPLADAGIPGYPWTLPEEFLRPDTGTAVVGLQIRGIAYNTNLVGPDEVPTDWPDIIDPRWSGRIGIADPASAPVYVGHWYTIGQAMGDDFLAKVGAQHPKVYASGSPATAALGAGEIAVFPMNIASITAEARDDGAPVEFVVPPVTCADEMQLALNATAANPNAARLFVHYLASQEGSETLARAGGEKSPYDTDLPELLEWDVETADEQKDAIVNELTT
ncbi:ABC transporter substrate-binding protein [Mycolicibacterium sp.]|uniref:ABC transporter substrate-binding protein n=2 Tax=Mycolicibacterium sp. TaxID=2320850 RepID=UPI003D0A2488